MFGLFLPTGQKYAMKVLSVISQTDDINTRKVVINRSFVIQTIYGFHSFNEQISSYFLNDSDSDSDSD